MTAQRGTLRRTCWLTCALVLALVCSTAVLPVPFAKAQTGAPASASQQEQEEGENTPTAAPTTAPAAANSKIERDETLFPQSVRRSVERLRKEVARLTKTVERVREDDTELDAQRPAIETISQTARATQAVLKPLLDTVKRQSDALGETPKAGDAPETSEIAAERQRLGLTLAELEGALKQTGLTRVRAKQLLTRIQTLRLENLGRDLRRRHVSPTTVGHWRQLFADLPRFANQIATVADNWWAIAWPRLHWFVLILLGAGALWWWLRLIVHRQLKAWVAEPLIESPPAYTRRVRMAVRSLPLLLAPGLVTLGTVYVALVATGLLNDQIETLAFSALKALGLFLVVKALAKAILLPWEPTWRLIGLPTPLARKYLRLTLLLAGVYCLDIWLNEVFKALHVPVSISVAETVLANLAFAALLFAFVWLPVKRDAGDGTFTRVSARLVQRAITWLRLPATIAVVAIVVATLLGYLAFGRFVAGQVMLGGVAAAAMLLGHLAARALAKPPEPKVTPQVDTKREPLALTGKRRKFALHCASFALNVLLVLAAVSLLLLSWGYASADIFGWGKSLLFGFEIGKFRFSLLQILLAVTLFVGVILLTRFFQSWLSRGVLNPEKMDRGIANSIHSGIGYAGVALAALIGVSYAGVDLSNVALIASALSIGIGFGLNAIASNFVSGLIMLIERPIKVGDWVVVGAHQGFVRHISVRATEIETFDRASVIIPNSDFMTSAVQNWTHRNAVGRVVVKIGASYNADPKQVMAVLRQVAAECDALLKYPAPSVQFEDFGASSLDFSVRGYIADVTSMLTAKTALRLGIAEAFGKADIEIPFPQQDVHLRDLDGVREMVGQALLTQRENACP